MLRDVSRRYRVDDNVAFWDITCFNNLAFWLAIICRLMCHVVIVSMIYSVTNGKFVKEWLYDLLAEFST